MYKGFVDLTLRHEKDLQGSLFISASFKCNHPVVDGIFCVCVGGGGGGGVTEDKLFSMYGIRT